MITEDDSRTTFELADRYIIEPTFNWWSKERKPNREGVKVEEGYCYASDTNTDWIDETAIRGMLDDYKTGS